MRSFILLHSSPIHTNIPEYQSEKSKEFIFSWIDSSYCFVEDLRIVFQKSIDHSKIDIHSIPFEFLLSLFRLFSIRRIGRITEESLNVIEIEVCGVSSHATEMGVHLELVVPTLT